MHGTPDPPSGRILLPLARDTADRRRVVATPDGAACETGYELLLSRDGWSIVRCTLVTGRTHQIRVHLASSGWPILGDAVYGRPDPRVTRQALHAARITLPHPLTRESRTFESPLPAELMRLIDAPTA